MTFKNKLRFSRSKQTLRTIGLVAAAGILLSVAFVHPWTSAAPVPTFIQSRANKITTGTANNLAFTTGNTQGNLIVVYAVWNNTAPVAISDTAGNTYFSAGTRQTFGTGGAWSSQIFYAKNIAGGANTVTSTYSTAVNSFGLMYIHEYSGLDKVNPFDVTSAATGTASAMNSGSVATTNANDLLFGAGASSNSVTQAGAGFATRSYAYGNRTEDRSVTSTGSYSATETQNGNAWVMQLVAFKADAGTADTAPPSVPANLTAIAASSTQINLSWAAALDNVDVAGYKIFRNGTQIATSIAPSYQSTSLTPSTEYSYTVSAYDAANNESAQSAAAVVTTQAPAEDTTAPTTSVTAPVADAMVSGTSTAIAATASDNVGVVGVQFMLDGALLGSEVISAPYTINWDTTAAANGAHVLTSKARDAAGNIAVSAGVAVTVSNITGTPTGFVAGYTFDDGIGNTAVDASGHGLTGTLLNGPTWEQGKYGTAVGLDGSNDYVNIGNSPDLQITGSLTTSAWIYAPAFPAKDAAIISKRGTGEKGYQLDTTVDRGTRTIGFKLTNSSGGQMFRYGATTLTPNTWYHVTGVYDATGKTMNVYLNGQLDNGDLIGTVTASQIGSPADALIGRRASTGYYFNGRIDDARIYNRALSASEVQVDMNTPLGTAGSSDPEPPMVHIHDIEPNQQVHDIVPIEAHAEDNVGVEGVQFFIDGNAVGSEDKEAPFALAWDTRTLANGPHTVTARGRDAAGNTALSEPVTVIVANSSYFQNEVLATNLNLPVAMKFMPNNNMLVVELTKGTIRSLAPPYTTANPAPFLNLPAAVSTQGYQRGIFDIALDPDFANNHFYYIFYTVASDDHDRLSRFTANADFTGTDISTEVILYDGPPNTNDEHHGGAITFGSQGKLFFTVGDGFNTPELAPLLNSPKGKIHRIDASCDALTHTPTQGNPNTACPNLIDNPFYDGSGSNVDSVWARGLRNPFRMSYDAPTDRLYLGDVGGNIKDTAKEELNVGVRGADYGWPATEGYCSGSCTSPVYAYNHNGRDAAITGGFVYHGTQMPSSFEGSYIFGDYAQNWIRRINFDANGANPVISNVEPADGSLDGPYGDITYLTQGPDGAIYYVDLGFSDVTGDFGMSRIRRIKYVQSNQAPVAIISSDVTTGSLPLNVTFSSTGSTDPEGQPLTYAWDFGDGTTSTEANPAHIYTQSGQYSVRLTVSDGVNTTISLPIAISAGNKPAITAFNPQESFTFRAGDVIAYNGEATDTEDGTLPDGAYTWTIDFLHEGHIHPGVPMVGSKNGTFTIPTTGHDFASNTRFRITLTVKDSNGLTSSQSVAVYPQKVNLTFNSPAGTVIYVDGIAHPTPFVYDTLIGFHHTIEARDQTVNGTTYTFDSWSDGGARQHGITVPDGDGTFTANFTATQGPAGLVGAWGFNENIGLTVGDSSTSANNGTLFGMGVSWNAEGKTGSALAFNGTAGGVTIPNSTTLNLTSSYTFETWIKPSALTGYQTLFIKEAAGNACGYWLQTNGTKISSGFNNGSGCKDHQTSGLALALNQWSHIAVVFDDVANTYTTYLNGVVVNSVAEAAAPAGNTAPLVLGQTIKTSGERWKGLMDDLRIYNRPLSATDIQTDMNTSLKAK